MGFVFENVTHSNPIALGEQPMPKLLSKTTLKSLAYGFAGASLYHMFLKTAPGKAYESAVVKKIG